MTPRLTLATASRVLTQLRHDHRTIALIIVLPCVVLGLIAWLFDGTPVLNQFGPVYVGIFPVVVMFLVTSVATLRERDRKSTRLNSSHVRISYAVFCLKKKKQ